MQIANSTVGRTNFFEEPITIQIHTKNKLYAIQFKRSFNFRIGYINTRFCFEFNILFITTIRD